MSGAHDDRPGVLIFPPLLFLIGLASGAIAHLVCPYRFAATPWTLGLGALLGLAAVTLGIWGERTMKAAGTHVRPDRPTLAIVSNGPFAYTRNPLYLAVLALFAAIGIALASPPFLAVLVPLFVVLRFGVVSREERYLEAKFGDLYRGYKARVRRWI